MLYYFNGRLNGIAKTRDVGVVKHFRFELPVSTWPLTSLFSKIKCRQLTRIIANLLFFNFQLNLTTSLTSAMNQLTEVSIFSVNYMPQKTSFANRKNLMIRVHKFIRFYVLTVHRVFSAWREWKTKIVRQTINS